MFAWLELYIFLSLIESNVSIHSSYYYRAVLVYPPSLDFVLAFLACLKVGVVAVPVFPPNPARRDTLHMFSKIVETCSAKYALTSLEYNHLKKIAGNYDEKRTRLPNIKVPECTDH